ncbi:sigma factor-like helix-turn-helix DNA-binding protein [Acrocarpospora corrugata]|uniref:sigma factor-like helix-turn-helix DNA-binding protein n=1 Tax=Acrocarpospora corrugata TaxID=35763 RepID=UPI0012D2E4D1|nr:sigma factor-like helix-turn-helix DNA-binding protein [Acrocarpospora corrugata]
MARPGEIALGRMERQMRLACFGELAETEIAELLGVPVGTVQSRTHRAQWHLHHVNG